MTDNKDFFSLNNVELEQAHEITIGARNGGKLFYFEQLCIKQREEINRLQAEKEALINGQETLQKYLAEQKAENERLKAEIEKSKVANSLFSMYVQTRDEVITEAKAEAYKEFAEGLKNRLIKGGLYPAFVKCRINELLKELVGDNNV